MSKIKSLEKKALIGLIITLASSLASAAPIYVQTLPKDKLSARDALKAAKSGTIVFKCARGTVSESAGISKASGAKTEFHVNLKDDDAALDAIQDGKRGYKCQPMTWDAERKKLANHRE